MKTQRDTFFDELYLLAKQDPNLIFISADQGAPSLDKFRKDFSNQYINVGIAEQQAILLAAGLALEGKNVYVHAIANFITLRCYEQIRLQLGAMKIPVKVVGVGAGLSYDDSGPTHHTIEDISALRVFPNLVIHNVTDSMMAKKLAHISYASNGPMYIRLDRKKFPNIYDEEDEIVSGVKSFGQGRDLVFVATGNMVHEALAACVTLEQKGVRSSVVDIYKLPINKNSFLEKIRGADKIVTLEEHFLPGGLGSAVIEVLSDSGCRVPVKRMGLEHDSGYCYSYGGRENLQSLYGIGQDDIVERSLKFLKENNA